jgi:hypothetical protein
MRVSVFVSVIRAFPLKEYTSLLETFSSVHRNCRATLNAMTTLCELLSDVASRGHNLELVRYHFDHFDYICEFFIRLSVKTDRALKSTAVALHR